MALHQKFIKKLSELKEAPIHRILGQEGLKMFVWDGNKCQQTFSRLSEVHDIIRTIDFLKEEGYITIEGSDSQIVPALIEHKDSSDEKNVNEYKFTQSLFEQYYNQILRAKLSLDGFIKDGYKTARKMEIKRSFIINAVIAGSAFVSAVVGTGSMVLALPQFSKQINNIQVKIDSIESNIQELYNRNVVEEFSFADVEGFKFQKHEKVNHLEVPLKHKPIANSVTLWFVDHQTNPTNYDIHDLSITLKLADYIDLGYMKSISEQIPNIIVVSYTKALAQ